MGRRLIRLSVYLFGRIFRAPQGIQDPFSNYELLQIRLDIRNLRIFGSVQCFFHGEFYGYDLKDGILTWRTRSMVQEKFSDVVGEIKLRRFFKNQQLMMLLYSHSLITKIKHS